MHNATLLPTLPIGMLIRGRRTTWLQHVTLSIIRLHIQETIKLCLATDRKTKQVLARGSCENGLYVLKDETHAFVATTGVSKRASYELWNARLGHVSFDVISTLNKLGVLSITSLLPKPTVCTPCKLAKGQQLSFNDNSKRSSHPLDLIHCDLWGPAPVCSKDGYRYYVAFIDDYSRFTWLYPLKTKMGFYSVLPTFINLA